MNFPARSCCSARRLWSVFSHAKVAVFGLGGVGGHAADALVRTGIGSFVLVDADRVSLTNLNRQIIADHETIGRLKTEVMREHMLRINPRVKTQEYPVFFFRTLLRIFWRTVIILSTPSTPYRPSFGWLSSDRLFPFP